MYDINELFWEADIRQMKKGYMYDKKNSQFVCLICGELYENGVIYPIDDKMYQAKKAIEIHVSKEHGSVFEYLVNMNKKFTGLTDIQKEILNYFYQGLSDKEIVKEQGGGSTSTIRNHRFKLKEKQKQAKVFLSLMELLNEQDNTDNKKNKNAKKEFVPIHKGATMMDDRFAITENEKEKIMNRYFKNGKLTTLPSKEKRKIIILQYLIEKFQPNKKYKENEVNGIIKTVFDDYVTIRRYFIEYGFMEREKDCSCYWVKL